MRKSHKLLASLGLIAAGLFTLPAQVQADLVVPPVPVDPSAYSGMGIALLVGAGIAVILTIVIAVLLIRMLKNKPQNKGVSNAKPR